MHQSECHNHITYEYYCLLLSTGRRHWTYAKLREFGRGPNKVTYHTYHLIPGHQRGKPAPTVGWPWQG